VTELVGVDTLQRPIIGLLGASSDSKRMVMSPALGDDNAEGLALPENLGRFSGFRIRFGRVVVMDTRVLDIQALS
jgi:hypothetical protein